MPLLSYLTNMIRIIIDDDVALELSKEQHQTLLSSIDTFAAEAIGLGCMHYSYEYRRTFCTFSKQHDMSLTIDTKYDELYAKQRAVNTAARAALSDFSYTSLDVREQTITLVFLDGRKVTAKVDAIGDVNDWVNSCG